jgi:ketosteroid isomerase-like protein
MLPCMTKRREGAMGNTRNIDELQQVLDAWTAGDPGPTADLLADQVVFENGPVPGPERWSVTVGRDAFFELLLTDAAYFNGTLQHLDQRCVYADDRVAVVTSRDSAVLPNGDAYETRPLMVARFDDAGKVDRLWVLELDVELIEGHFSRNPLPAPVGSRP